jgi:hypothetical protein
VAGGRLLESLFITIDPVFIASPTTSAASAAALLVTTVFTSWRKAAIAMTSHLPALNKEATSSIVIRP